MKHLKKQKIGALSIFFGLSFLFHLLWENIQAPLFIGFESFSQHFFICLFATATGDMIFTAIIYLAIAAVNKDLWWILKKESYERICTWVIAIVVGIFLAVTFEFWAVKLVERWEYGSMPTIPFVGIGITPIVQMIVVPIIVLWMSRSAIIKKKLLS